MNINFIPSLSGNPAQIRIDGDNKYENFYLKQKAKEYEGKTFKLQIAYGTVLVFVEELPL